MCHIGLGTAEEPRIPIIGWCMNKMSANITRQPVNNRPRQVVIHCNQPFQQSINWNPNLINNNFIPR